MEYLSDHEFNKMILTTHPNDWLHRIRELNWRRKKVITRNQFDQTIRHIPIFAIYELARDNIIESEWAMEVLENYDNLANAELVAYWLVRDKSLTSITEEWYDKHFEGVVDDLSSIWGNEHGNSD